VKHLRLAVLLSGGGRTLENIFNHIAEGKLDAEVVVVGSSRADAYGLERARARGVPTFVASSRESPATSEFRKAISAAMGNSVFDLLLLAGFICMV